MIPFHLILRQGCWLLAASVMSTQAATIPGLFNSGVANNGVALAVGAQDPHYILTAAAQGPINTGAIVMANNTAWLANSAASTWIGVVNSGAANVAVGDYNFRITFDLTGLEPSTAQITFKVSVDNSMSDVLINGASTGLSFDGFAGFSSPMTISSGFIDGINTLEFRTVNGGTSANPGGFRVEIVSGTADPQPPPGTPPSITANPASQSIGLLDPATFAVGAFGSRPFTYQWRKGGAPISGATNFNYTIPTVRGTDAGSYDVIVSNGSGSATSAAATLTVVFLSPAQLTYEPIGASSRRTGLTFSEIMYHPAPNADGRRTEFVEIYNSNPFIEDLSGWRLTGDFDYTFPSNTVLQGNSYLVVAPVPADVEAAYGISGVLGGSTNNLSNDGGTVRLRKRSGAIVLEANYSDQPPWPAAADGTGHSLVLARPSYGENNPKAWAASAFKGGSPGGPDPIPTGSLESVVINEFLAHTDLPLKDYVELFNNGAQPADISGCWLSDDPATNKFRIPNGTTLGSRGFISFDQDQLGFALQADGETIYLVNSNQNRVIDAVRYEGQANGVASGRSPDGAPGFQALNARTPGTTNAAPRQPQIVINEIMYHPISGDNDDEYVELYNRGPISVNLGGWRFISGIGYTFPANTTIPAGGYLVVAANAARLMTNYAGLTSANLVGNFSGSLANSGERLALAMPDFGFSTNGTVITTNVFYIVVNEVTYLDGGKWGQWSDGGGSSLELVDPHSDNRQPSNWADSDETHKSAWTLVEYTGALDLGSGVADRLHAMLLDKGEALLDDVEVLVSGQNRVLNPDFEAGTNNWRFGGTHVLSTPETTEGFNSARSVHIRASARGDNTANRLVAVLSPAVPGSGTATIRAKARWLRGHPELLLRLKGNWLEAFGRLSVPANLGTPGAPNSQLKINAGPAIVDVGHRPILPQAGQAIRVSARISDPDGIGSVTLTYRIDGDVGQFNVPMVDDGTGADAMAGDGVFTALIPGQSSGKLVAFRVQAGDNAVPGATSLFPNDAPTRECLVRVGEVQPPGAFGAYHLWLTAATVATWGNREKLSNHDLDGTFVYGTTRAVYNVGAHYSGSPYTSPGYTGPVGASCGYDISFPADELFLGEDHTVLDWPVRDATDQREQTMFWLLDQHGLPNMYRRYVIMYVNGNRRGEIYDDIQQPSGSTVEQWFSDDPDGTLVKPDCWDEFNDIGDRETGCLGLNSLQLFTSGGVKKLARYRWIWKPRSINGTANDYSEIFNLVDAANAPTNGFQSAMESQADMENWMRTFAANDLVSFWDAFGNPNAKNTFFYKPERGTWQLMCWDMDVGLGANTVNAAGEATNAELFPVLNDSQMNRVYTNPAWLRLYWGAMDQAVNTFFQASAVTPLLQSKYAAFQASGLNLTSPFVPSGGVNLSIPDWITARRNFLLGQLNSASVSNVFNVANPSSFSTNRNLAFLSGTAPVRVYTITVNGVVYTPTWVSVTGWRLLIPVSSGTNILNIAGQDRFGNPVPGASRTVAVDYTGVDERPEDNLVINEIMYNPAVPEASFVEIFNRSTTYTFNIAGWRLNGVDFTFPPGSVITNRGFLVVCKDRPAFGNAYGWGIPTVGQFDGQLDDGGETLTLIKPGVTPALDLVVDRVTYDDDLPWPSRADGTGASLQLIDANQDNSRVSNWSDDDEWRYISYTGTVSGGISQGTNFLIFLATAGELYIDDVVLVTGSVPNAGPNLLVNGDFESVLSGPWAVLGNHSNSVISTQYSHSGNASLRVVAAGAGSASSTLRQIITPFAANTECTVSFWIRAATNSPQIVLRTTPGSSFVSANTTRPVSATPGSANSVSVPMTPYDALWLNELEADNVTGPLDNAGQRDPWIELYNAGAAPIDLSGYFLANNYNTNLTQWQFPAGSSIAPGEFKVVWADGQPAQSSGASLHTSFRLNSTTGSVALVRLDGGRPQITDYLTYSGLAPDRSYGDFPDGQNYQRRQFNRVTPGGTNDATAPPVTLFINEWMAANTTFLADPIDQDFDDWFEIYNPGTSRVDLAGFTLTDDFARPDKSTVPDGISIAAGGYLLVWADEESSQTRTNGDLHVSFKLSQDTEQIGLYDPAGRLIDSVTFGRQTNNISQGRAPDGAPAPYAFMKTPTPRGPNVVDVVYPTLSKPTFGPGNTINFVWTSQPGRNYRVQYKDNLNQPLWNDLAGDVSSTGTTATKSDTLGTGQRFYRILVLP